VVKVRVTSTKERPGEDWEGCGSENRLFRKEQMLEPTHADRSFPPDRAEHSQELLCY